MPYPPLFLFDAGPLPWSCAVKICHIVAMSENNVIAKEGAIPWLLREDLQRFRALTLGHPIVMGSATFDSLGRQPLKGRKNIVLSRRAEILYDGRAHSYAEHGKAVEGGEGRYLAFDVKGVPVYFAPSWEVALMLCGDAPEVYVIGGGDVYRQTLEDAHALRVTIVHQEVEADDTCVFYPEIDERLWRPVFTQAGETHSYVDYARFV